MGFLLAGNALLVLYILLLIFKKVTPLISRAESFNASMLSCCSTPDQTLLLRTPPVHHLVRLLYLVATQPSSQLS